MSERMSHLAQHDDLTGLPNTAFLKERLDHVLSLARRHGKQVAVLFIDLNRFKDINDAHGHDLGDQVLKSIADRLQVCVRESDTVCRRGGDEFVIVLTEIECPGDAARVAEKALRAAGKPLVIDGHAVEVGASIGISLFPGDSADVDALMRLADVAMYQAKAAGRDGYCFAGTRLPSEAHYPVTCPGS